MKILYSPIGNSDPINLFYDGPMLACCRKIVPDEVILFLTKDMSEKEDSKQLYSTSISLLSGKLNTEMRCVLNKHTEITDPQKMANVFEPILHELTKLAEDHENDELYLNVSSGTPAIKNTLELLSYILPYKFTLLHVYMPTSEIRRQLDDGRRDIVSKDADIEELWELNYDNEGEQSRVHETLPDKKDETPISRCFLHTRLVKLIEECEYRSALGLLSAETSADDPLKKALQGALMRSQYNFQLAFKQLEEAGWEDAAILKKYSGVSLFMAAEAVLAMHNAMVRGDYRDMLLRMTPVMPAVAAEALEKNEIKVGNFVTNGKIYRDKLLQTLPNIPDSVVNNIFRYKETPYLEDWHYIDILEATGKDPNLVQKLKALRDVETKARNEMAHQLSYMDDNKLKQIIGITPEKLIKDLHDVFSTLGIKYINSSYWMSYSRMNSFIIGLAKI